MGSFQDHISGLPRSHLQPPKQFLAIWKPGFQNQGPPQERDPQVIEEPHGNFGSSHVHVPDSVHLAGRMRPPPPPRFVRNFQAELQRVPRNGQMLTKWSTNEEVMGANGLSFASRLHLSYPGLRLFGFWARDLLPERPKALQ